MDFPKEEKSSSPVDAVADIPDTAGTPEVSPTSEPVLKYDNWGTVLHPSQPMVTVGVLPSPTPMPKLRGKSWVLSQKTPVTLPPCLSKTPLPPTSSPPAKALALARPPTLPQGFAEVAACLKTPELVEVGEETPIGPMSIGLVATPSISSVSSTWVMKDDMTGLVYMDTVTTSVGRVVLGMDPATPSDRPVIKEIMEQE